MTAKLHTSMTLGLALLLGACSGHNASHSAVDTKTPPREEVWLKPQEVEQARIVAKAVGEERVEQWLATSGRVTFVDVDVEHVFSPVSGRIAKILAPLGAAVKKGDALAQIVSPDIGVASSDVGKARADLIAAEHNYQRQKSLFAQKAAAEIDVETSEDNYRKAKAEFERAHQRMLLMRGGSEDVSQGYTLRSAIDGEVLMRGATPGMEVQGQYSVGSALELFTIGTVDRVWVIADIYEIDLARVAVGAKVKVNVVSYPERTFSGQVDWVSPTLDPVLRTAKVRAVFDNKDRALRPEMYATVSIETAEKRALAIPRMSLFRVDELNFVFLDKGLSPSGQQRFQRVPVVANEGQASGLVEVKHGLSAGQLVVVEGMAQLRSLLDNSSGSGD